MTPPPTILHHWYKQLPGHFDFEDLYLYEAARIPAGGSVVEVGVFCGRSLAFLLVEFANRAKRVSVAGVDLFTQTPEMTGAASKGLLTRQLASRGLEVNLIQSLSWEAAVQFEDRSQDFVFIDASHEYEDVKRDLDAWWPKVKVGGTFAGHDFTNHHPGVVKAVQEKFPAKWDLQAGSCWRLTKVME